jgi:fructokinase
MSTATTLLNDSAIVVAAVEGGGTSFKVAVVRLHLLSPSSSSASSSPSSSSRSSSDYRVEILHRHEFSSDADPHWCLHQCAAFFRTHKPPQGGYRALGVACFGPLGLHPNTPTYGQILPSSPKAIWRNVDILTPLAEACRTNYDDGVTVTHEELAVRIDTDVNAPALVEYRRALLVQQQQQQQGDSVDDAADVALLSSCAYITVGTGVGVGLVVNGRTVHGRMHPEAGHVLVPPLFKNDPFEGYSWGKDTCPYQGMNTVEGTTCSVALVERLQQQMPLVKTKDKEGDGRRGDQEASEMSSWSSSTAQGRNVLATLEDDHELWEHAVNAIASLCVTLLLTVSIERIVIGGGIVQHRPILLKRIRERVPLLVNGYLELPSDLSELIVTSEHGDDAGLYGAIGLAREALLQQGGSDVMGSTSKAATSREEDEKRMKQVAFGHGLWHGVLVGGVGTAMLLAYAVIPLLNRSSRRRRGS